MRLLWFNLRMQREHPITAFAIDWVNKVAELVEHVDVVTMMAGDYKVRENVSVYSVGKERGYNKLRRVLEFYRILRDLLSGNEYDACFIHMIAIFAVMGTPFLKINRIPTTLWYTHKSVTPRLRLAEKFVDRIVTASSESCRISSPKVIVIGHGVDTDRFTPAVTPCAIGQQFTITSVGRIAPIKRLEILVEAVRVLVSDYDLTEMCVRLVGNIYPRDALYAQQIRHQIEAYGLETIINFTGAVPYEDVVREYRQADVAVNLSPTGGVDKVVLEAMSCGTPVVVANETFHPILGRWASTLLMSSSLPSELAKRLHDLAKLSATDRSTLGNELRQLVLKEHSLHQLSRLLVREILPN